MKKYFPPADPQKSIAQNEEETLHFWKEGDIFQRSIDTRSHRNPFVFFDGPPFATGLPHYGHILAGAIKDVIPRYATMKGYRVERKWGWDCHGVPVEFQVEKEHQIGGKPEIEKMGAAKFNELCRSVVMRCRDDWERTVDRMGRFVDFKDDYKTMDVNFMESVWWVFAELWKKGLIYEGHKVLAYSPKLGSPLSNFEAGLNYKDIDDPAVTVKFELVGEPGTYVLAWTTTPWTLPSNLGLAVNAKLQYVKVTQGEETFIVVENILNHYFPDIILNKKSKAKGIWDGNRYRGEELIGKKYKPLFSFFENHKNAFQIFAGDFVSDDDGTGVVHLAPTGPEDAEVFAKEKVELVYPYDENGYFDFSEVPHNEVPGIKDLEGKYFRSDPEVEGSAENNANDWVIEELKKQNLLFKREQIRHSYPHCWRSDCALMYRGVNTWFVNVGKIKKDLVDKNQEIYWIPEHLKDGRFGKILEDAPDWAISRNRFWGAPIPAWKCDKTGEVQVVSSRSELEKLSGKKVDDLHKHFVDELTWKNEKTGGTMHRIPEVLDCWFESGSMPYASIHYPFSNQNPGSAEFEPEFKGEFREADFIAEGLDQTRGWFYTLHVLGVALFGKNIFKNVITNGIVLAEDGEKMSKSKKNYPDPNLIFDKYGADAMRFYLLNSPVARGENLRFSEHGVEEVLKSVILPLRSSYQFFSTYANIDDWKPTKFVFVRHGEADHNTIDIFSGHPENPHHLTKKGQTQMKNLAQKLPDFDMLITSPFIRTKETAEILKQEKKFRGGIEIDERIRELHFGSLEGKPAVSLLNLQDSDVESIPECMERMKSFFDDMTQKHPGKTICVVSHGGPIRRIESSLHDVSDIHEMAQIPMLHTGDAKILFPNPNSQNELDGWILSETQTLLQKFREAFDAYNLEGGLQLLPPFIDNLNNWYLRRSRKRFWAEGMSEDKNSAYETLHFVLLTLSKILAPVCPFFSEKMYQDLGGGESVHLELFPFALEKYIDKKTEDKVHISREIVGLAAGIRARAKIKLRQPLSKLRFVTTSKAKIDLDIIREEANVKEIEVLASVEGIAQKIVRVNAKKVGPRLGGKVQELIRAGKEGDFKEGKDGVLEIVGEKLSPKEYEWGFVCEEGVEAEATAQTVVLIDTEVTEELRLEGTARELIRTIQELRKTNDFDVSDRITVHYETRSELLKNAFHIHRDMITTEVLATDIISGSEDLSVDSIEVDGEEIALEVIKNE